MLHSAPKTIHAYIHTYIHKHIQAFENGQILKRPPDHVLHGALTGGLHAMADSPIAYEPRIMNWLPGMNPCMYMCMYVRMYVCMGLTYHG